ncbi:MAG TPA: Tex-like N-terminal domain-containing protein, partial [bacterium]|nr:Tex-like N-terminal domain-containing protein [bacterium]
MVPFASEIAARLQLKIPQVEATLTLFGEGATIPFIARYRKDRTGALDEVQIQLIQDTANFLKEFSERKAFIEKTITEQGKMTEEVQGQLDKATTLAELEDIYLPYKPKRKTRAQMARENGLEAFALLILEQRPMDVMGAAKAFVSEKVASEEDALQGARDIIAEMINEDANVRGRMRRFFEEKATLQSKVVPEKEAEAIKFKDYFDYHEPASAVPSHRILAVLRGFLEGFLRVAIGPEEEAALALISEQYVTGSGPASEQVSKAIKESYRRLLQPSLETELRTLLKTRGDEDAIQVFAENLRQLLLSSPLGSKRVLALDPGYRTGCKVVCLDEKGDLLGNDVIYVHEANRVEASAAKV